MAVRDQALRDDGLKRDVGFLGLIWASEGSIIGSGWLFGAILATAIAGPAALLAWIGASIIVIFLALVHAELGGMFPVTGGTSRFPHYAFGSLAGATFGWFSYIQAASVAPIEVLAVIQYASVASWAHSWYNPTTGTLSGAGIAVAIALMAIFTVVNLLGVRWLSRVNSAVTTWKVLIPILTILIFLLLHFHAHNFSAVTGFFVTKTQAPPLHSTFVPSGTGAKSVLGAVVGGGIVFSLLGFEQAVQLGGESSNPQRDLPRAVIGSILLGAAIYVLVQFAFIGAISPANLLHLHSWNALEELPKFGGLDSAPFYTVARVAGLVWLAWILRVDAVVSPGGTGLIYLTSASRISYGLSRNGYIPKSFESRTRETKVPVVSLIIAFLIGLLFLLPFPSWGKLVGVVTSASVMMYAGAPLAMGALRMSKPNLFRPYRLAAGHVLAPMTFILANWIVYWSGWQVISTLMFVMLIGYVLMLISAGLHLNPNQPRIDWQAAVWIFPYLIGMAVISYFGQFGPGGILDGVGPFKHTLVGGDGRIPLWVDLGVLAVFSLLIYGLAMWKRLPERQVDEYVDQVFPPSEELTV